MKVIKIVSIIIGLAILTVAGFYIVNLIKHAQPIPEGAVSMDYPLKDGKFWVVQSGRNGKIHSIPTEKYALDITRYPTLQSWFKFRQTDLNSDISFGTPIYSPCKGPVKKTIKNFPDVPIGLNGSPNETNLVVVGCDGFSVSMQHFEQDSILVNEGEMVDVGQEIGQMGNSGNSSGPHLHMAAYKIDPQAQATINVPITFNGKYFYRGDSFTN